MIDDISSLEQSVEAINTMTDKELNDMKRRYASSARKSQTIDLHAYRRAQQGTDERSAYEKMADSVKTFFGFTPERKLGRMIEHAKSLHSVYSQTLDKLEDTVSEQTVQLKKVGQENVMHRGLFIAITEQFERQRAGLDRMEAELEHHGDTLTQKSYDLRERVMSAQNELRCIEHEANEAMHMYTSSSSRYEAMVGKHKATSQQLAAFERQRTNVSILIDEWELQREISGGGTTPSLNEQYMELGALAQDINAFFKDNFSRKGEFGVDATYTTRIGEEREDPLVERWMRVREQ